MKSIVILGELEKQVLNYLWDNDEANAKQVHTAFNAERPGSLNTIQSTLERLYKKKLLSRRKSSHAYIYRPRVKREALMARLIRDADLTPPAQLVNPCLEPNWFENRDVP